MSLETPRSTAGLATPRTYQEVSDSFDDFRDDSIGYDEWYEASDHEDEDGELCYSCWENESISDDDVKFNVASNLINVCSDCDKCEGKIMYQLDLLDRKFTEELSARNRQMQLMVDYEKKTRDWFSEKNAVIERLQTEKIDAENERIALAEQLEAVSVHLSNLENYFSDVHEKYERAKKTIHILNCNVTTLKNSLQEHEECMKQKQDQFEQLKKHAMERLNQANAHLDSAEKSFSSECRMLRTGVENCEAKVGELTEQLERKSRENTELTSICEFLLESFQKPRSPSYDELVHTNATIWLGNVRNVEKC